MSGDNAKAPSFQDLTGATAFGFGYLNWRDGSPRMGMIVARFTF
jgi:hypothetical protein